MRDVILYGISGNWNAVVKGETYINILGAMIR